MRRARWFVCRILKVAKDRSWIRLSAGWELPTLREALELQRGLARGWTIIREDINTVREVVS
jgi:hypothetical protein